MAGRTAAAAGSCRSCWLSQERSAPSPSRTFCCGLCLTFAEDQKKQTGMERSGPTPCSAAWPGGSGCGTPPLLDCITSHLRAAASLFIRGLRMCDDSMSQLTLFGCTASAVVTQAHIHGDDSPTQYFTHWPLDLRPSYARSLIPSPCKTVDQNPPPLKGWGRPAPSQCELNLLGRPWGLAG